MHCRLLQLEGGVVKRATDPIWSVKVYQIKSYSYGTGNALPPNASKAFAPEMTQTLDSLVKRDIGPRATCASVHSGNALPPNATKALHLR